MGRIDHVHAAERLFGQAAEILPLIFIDEQDATAGSKQFVSSDNARQPAAHDGNVSSVVLSGHECSRA